MKRKGKLVSPRVLSNTIRMEIDREGKIDATGSQEYSTVCLCQEE